jgi:ribosomal protein S19E (S16A)
MPEVEVPPLSEEAKDLLSQFATDYVRKGRFTIVSLPTIAGYLRERGVMDPRAVVEELEKANLIRRTRKGYYLTKYGYRVSEQIWGRGLEKLVPAGV